MSATSMMFYSLAMMFLVLALTGCNSWPPSAMPQYSPDLAYAGKVRPGTFESRLQVEVYDAARKINRQK